MDVFFKASVLVLLVLILYLVMVKTDKDFAYILSLGACCIVLFCAFSFLKPVIECFRNMQTIAELDSNVLSIVIKTVGIGIIAEVVSAFCADAGNASLSKTIQILATAVILSLSTPLFESMLSLIEDWLVII